MMKNLGNCRHHMNNANAATIFGTSQIRTPLITVFSSLLFFSLLYFHFCSLNNGAINAVAVAVAAADSTILSVQRLREGGGTGGSYSSINSDTTTITENNTTDPCSGRYIYVYDLPPEFNDEIISNCRSLIKWVDLCPYIQNLGFGRKLEIHKNGLFPLLQGEDNSSIGWYKTNQFFLELIFHNRMKRYECLTNDSSSASAVFVPFYAGLDVGRYLWESNTSVRDSASFRLVKWLVKRPEWRATWGSDHFLITGRISWDFQRQIESDSNNIGSNGNESYWGNRFLLLPETKNMTVLGIESSFGPDFENEISIPYPTNFHPSTDKEVLLWQQRLQTPRRRPYLFSFVGAARPNMPNSVRGEMMKQCLEASGRRAACKLMECTRGITNKCEDPVGVITLFAHSTFCLQPRGDSYTRRSIFDSILAGCIPVFFHEGSAYLQYKWHLPRNRTKYSVFIPESDVNDRKVSIVEILKGVSEEQVLAMREEVIRLIPSVVYADPMSRLKAFEDALDIAVQGVLERVEKLRKDRGY